VIPGWDIAMQMMREGGKMLVIIPPEMAYGTRGDPPRVPRRATLVFEISLEKIERTTTPPPPPPPPPPKKKKWWSLEKTQ
jgi:FKBP-type peptidyl-prolyl cis-trans isomerase 2